MRRVLVVSFGALLAGCPAGGTPARDAAVLVDAGDRDAGSTSDAGRDAGSDGGFDAGTDAGYDAGPSMCDLPTACVAGAVEETDDCGRCGARTRFCNSSCVWTDFECIEHDDRCDYWLHPDGATGWTGYRLRASAFGPSTPIRAAVPLDGTEDALVFTSTTFHRLRRTCEPGVTECWVESGPLSAMFPEVGGDPILYANDVPAAYRGDGFEGIDLIGMANGYRYRYEVATRMITHTSTDPTPVPGPGEPVRATVRAAFTVLGNAAGWLTAPCGTPPAVPTDYIASVAATDVYVFAPDAGCLSYFHAPYATFGPFGAPGAPPLARVGAAFHRGGLFILAE
ncbi:MAG: hypothetical protein H6719_26660 [Sandaracinaceae bacterium]|nr:hypothetical protein [Sandaracinaceae bacterium]